MLLSKNIQSLKNDIQKLNYVIFWTCLKFDCESVWKLSAKHIIDSAILVLFKISQPVR